MRIRNSLTIPALALALLAGASTIGAVTGGSDPRPPAITEDDPHWDCTTQGNRICGVNEHERATAWRAWDAHEGWRSIAVDPDRAMRIDVTGWSLNPEKVEGLTLRGDDGRWYVYNVTYTQP